MSSLKLILFFGSYGMMRWLGNVEIKFHRNRAKYEKEQLVISGVAVLCNNFLNFIFIRQQFFFFWFCKFSGFFCMLCQLITFSQYFIDFFFLCNMLTLIFTLQYSLFINSDRKSVYRHYGCSIECSQYTLFLLFYWCWKTSLRSTFLHYVLVVFFLIVNCINCNFMQMSVICFKSFTCNENVF